jgi:23S rRNA pseudouridine1911/1915/1917 synthase
LVCLGEGRKYMAEQELDPNEADVSDLYQDYLEIRVDPGQELLRIDKFLKERLRKVTRNRIQNAIRTGSVLVNNELIKPNYKVRPNDLIQVVVPHPPGDGIRPWHPRIFPSILFTRMRMCCWSIKRQGMVVHPGIGNYDGTLVNALAYHYGTHSLPIMKGNLGDRIGLVHRIDKNTSGLLVVAKTEYAMSHLAKQFFNHTIDRKYQAIVWGEPDPEAGTITGHIDRHPRNRTIRAVFPEGEKGKHAITHYKMIEPLYYVSLIECQLETGRTHQIRVHMQYKGHPLFGDSKYGGDKVVKGTVYSKYKQFVDNCLKVLPRQGLHAQSLGFEHPTTGKRVYFEAPLPDDMQQCLEAWRNYVNDRKSKKLL